MVKRKGVGEEKGEEEKGEREEGEEEVELR